MMKRPFSTPCQFFHSRPSSSKRPATSPATMGRSFEEDPLTLAIAPPPDETPEQRQAREIAEAEARKISDEIDEQIRREREGDRKKKKPVKLLLLGQSESGKTATLKNFQLTYARREWSEERASWRAVIQLNLVRNVNQILDHLTQEMTGQSVEHPSDDSSEDLHARRAPKLPPLRFKEKHRLLKMRLGPLSGVQTDLERNLGAASTELYTTSVTTAAPFDHAVNRRALQEFSINSTNGWKTALDKFRTMRTTRPENGSGSTRKMKDNEDDISEVIASCKDDIKAIWEDPLVKEMLNRRKVRIEDTPGFFLNDTDRIATRNYQPTDDDVIRARLRTLGVQEYRFIFDHGRTVGQEWRLYDVGGTRSSRAAWYPYFDDVDAIIFLAPISPFDEKLAEDRRVNRLEDSYLLWKSVCSCKLLARTQIILFLNKCDLLQAKLQRGVRIRDSVPSFGDRKNDLPTATRYFQQHFRDISKQHSPVPRPFYMYLTSVIDTRSTAVTLGAVEESILREHLRHADLM
ncbi:Guanine nucleotide-binding protein alpha-4 subunit [Hypsizygus marmoreus]|uniref:Guanine nucleotide-binding protein alpha-4 subunit n=1 Tax=Hypsizygus marmoreus TaxID=39966 RepID=A0A369JDI4_HYPMA|nr:Guanine nucleotide-binding protein alpha-4 subunit [Hypsizygus marmoreus]